MQIAWCQENFTLSHVNATRGARRLTKSILRRFVTNIDGSVSLVMTSTNSVVTPGGFFCHLISILKKSVNKKMIFLYINTNSNGSWPSLLAFALSISLALRESVSVKIFIPKVVKKSVIASWRRRRRWRRRRWQRRRWWHLQQRRRYFLSPKLIFILF